MRTFFAVAPPAAAARAIEKHYAPMRDAWKGIKWVTPDRYHITLAFLGEKDPGVVEAAAEAAGTVLRGFGSFDIGFAGPGRFGSPESPKVLLLKVGRGKDRLSMIRESLKPVLVKYSMWEEGDYRPHLTLGRGRRHGVKGPEGGLLLPPGMKRDNVGTFTAGKVILYRSVLTDRGPEYSEYASWPLEGGRQ